MFIDSNTDLGGTFKVKIVFPSTYPFKAPSVNMLNLLKMVRYLYMLIQLTFGTKVYHPGINEEGMLRGPEVLKSSTKP